MPAYPVEYLASWHDGPYRLHLFTNHETDEFGKTELSYQFRHNGDIVFEGDDYCSSPMHAIDGAESVAGLLAFLSLRPGDTDAEYFAAYTADQLAWADMHAEELSAYLASGRPEYGDSCEVDVIALGMCDMSDLPEVADYLARAMATT